MPQWRLVPTKQFEDDFRRLPKNVQSQVLRVLERIEVNPYRALKLSGVKFGQWRYRMGDYRIRYDIEGSAIILKLVRHRKEVYRDK